MAAGHPAFQGIEAITLPNAFLVDTARGVLWSRCNYEQGLASLVEDIVDLHVWVIGVLQRSFPSISVENLMKLSKEDIHNGHF